jgi:Gpi18-like mannosyltransferase
LSRTTPYRRRIWDAVVLLFLLGTTWVLASLAYRPLRAAAFTMDAPPVMLPHEGLHEHEQFPDDPRVYRWTKGQGQVELPNPGGPVVVQVGLAGGTRSAVPVEIHAAGMTLPFQVDAGLRTYALLLPATQGERLSLTVESPTFEAHNRTLGVVVSFLSISGGGAVPAQVLLVQAFATLGIYLLLRHVGVRSVPAVLAVLLLQALVLAWQVAGGWRYGLFGPLLLLAGTAGLAALVLERWYPAAPALPTSPVTFSRRDGQVIALLLLVALAVRLPWLGAPDPVGDMELAARRMWFLHDYGLAGSYLYGGDYVPIRLYLLWGLSQLVQPLGGDFFAPLPAVTMTLIKLPGMLADLVTVAIIYLWSRRWSGMRTAALIAALYTLSPPVWMNVAWWGQVDTLLMLPLLGTVLLLGRANGRWSWLCWMVALLIKPQAIILAPLLFVATLRLHGSRGVLQGSALAVGLFVPACTPLVLAGQGPGLLQAYAGAVGRFPRLTIRAYNLWYLVSPGGAGVDDVPVLGPLTYRLLGIVLLGCAALLVSVALLRRADGPMRVEGAAVLALAFFALPTQIHERYLFLTLAFLALCIARDERMVLPYVILVFTATINILGVLDGFVPPAAAAITASPLPLLCAGVNLTILLGLLGHLLVSSGVVPGTTAALRPAHHRSDPLS